MLSISAYEGSPTAEEPHYALVLRDRDGDELTTVTDIDQDIPAGDSGIVRDGRRKAIRVATRKIGGVLEVLSSL